MTFKCFKQYRLWTRYMLLKLKSMLDYHQKLISLNVESSKDIDDLFSTQSKGKGTIHYYGYNDEWYLLSSSIELFFVLNYGNILTTKI